MVTFVLSKRSLPLVLALAIAIFPFSALAQSYTSVVVFGDSLSDVGNDAAVSAAKYTVAAQVPAPVSGYTLGRFTDGFDTIPPARNYTGVWVEQLAAKLAAHPTITNSLNGGTDYAYGFATTNTGTSPFTYGPGNALSFNVNNMGQQISTYLSTGPTITNKTLFIVWGGANDLIAATSSADIVAAATRDVGLVQQLILAGATDFIVPNLPPLGLVPRFNGSAATSSAVTAAVQGYNQALAAGLAILPAANPGKTLHIYQLDTYTLFNAIVGPPIGYGFANVTASSQANATVNPDTYLFWDDLHPTTYGHSLIASAALTLLGPTVMTTTTVSSSNLNANLNASVTLTATVTATTGTPIGTVSFMDGSTVLGTAQLSGTTSTGTATYTTSKLTAGTHAITATYAGVNGYGGSTSPSISQMVVAPSFSASVSPTSLTIARGGSAAATVTVTPAGGYTGSFTVACGTVPAHVTCTIGSSSLTISSGAASTIFVINTTSTSSHNDSLKIRKSQEPVFAMIGFPLVLGLAFATRRRPIQFPVLLAVALVSGLAMLGLVGCGGDALANSAAVGSFTVPISVTPTSGSSGSATTVNLAVTVQ